ncbi:MAG: hypothetical protein ABL982_10695 [Vicinamibacterales bacterium]
MSGRHFIHLTDAEKLAKMRKRFPESAAALASLVDAVWSVQVENERQERSDAIMAAARGHRAPRSKRHQGGAK